MQLTILGGGGFRVPLVYRALLDDRSEGRITRVVLHDLDGRRLAAIMRVLGQQAEGVEDAPQLVATTDLDEALRGTDFVFSAIRVGGSQGRVIDEEVAIAAGVLGQETVGAGGISYGLRTVPVAVRLAQQIAEQAPHAWVINFTNPAGLVTEAMSHSLGDRVIGICDSSVGLGRRVARVLGVDPDTASFDYVGLNHLGWLRGVYVDGENLLPRLLADDAALASFEEGKLFAPEWLRAIGAVPNEYLHYYYYNREAVAAERSETQTRAAFLHEQQNRFYARMDAEAAGKDTVGAAAQRPLDLWNAVRQEREQTYMATNRKIADAGDRNSSDVGSGGYENVALALMRALTLDEEATLILNVRNRGALTALDHDAVVEIPCSVDAKGARPAVGEPLPDHCLGLVCAVKSVERAIIEAATTGSRAAALRAFATHPLVDSVNVAHDLLDAYQQRIPELKYLS